ncbi:MAG: carboxypeptidase-like regulatory domain-containing protein, partial [candidate division Zixibacteria bacterium]|nr:carboxypeptidase-like regulatory domain-containing protein [candidate division Zixibacteria bacterium]
MKIIDAGGHVRLLIFLILLAPIQLYASSKTIQGNVRDIQNNEIIGATVIVYHEDRLLGGAATDLDGKFKINLSAESDDTLIVQISSIGYSKQSRKVIVNQDTTSIQCLLEEKPIEVETVVVTPNTRKTAYKTTTQKEQIIRASNHSLIASDPIQAIKQPQVIKVGSNHSSKIRINGTSPKYYINGLDIGYDPNHYGMFSIVPAPILSEINLYPQGTSARYGLPSAIELTTAKPFKKHFSNEFNLSVLEATGTMSWGKDDYFFLTSVRKSILDRLVDQFESHSNRKKFPPANFRDIFITAGLRLTKNHRLLIDQYYVDDYLRYISDPSLRNPDGIYISQNSNESYLGVRFEAIGQNLLLKTGGAIKSSSEKYFAKPELLNHQSDFVVDLKTKRHLVTGNIETMILIGSSSFSIGNAMEHTARRDIDLNHSNWNFLPPDYISDNPYIYQRAINQLFKNYSTSDSELNNATYVSYEHNIEYLKIETGIRSEYFSKLAGSRTMLFRQSLIIQAGENSNIELFYGTFAENPINRLTEAYQILIHDSLHKLKPIGIRLASVSFLRNPLKISLFHKTLSDMPVLTPDFDYRDPDGTIREGFLTMNSDDRLRIYGGDISLQIDGFIRPEFNIFTY